MSDLYPVRHCGETPAWAMMELGHTDLGDMRRTQRLVRLTAALAANPACSLPEACESWAEPRGAYRFLENDEIEPEDILSGHRDSTVHRIGEYPLILAVQDTTGYNFTGYPATRGLGTIGRRSTRRPHSMGFFVHACLAVTPEGVPLGLLGQSLWVRRTAEGDSEGEENAQESGATPEDKESLRWVEMLRSSTQGLPAGTKVITVADREADIFAFFAEALRLGQEALVRAHHNRWLAREDRRLWTVLDEAELAGTMDIQAPRADNRPPRSATLELRTALVHLRNPKTTTKLLLSAVLAREIHPPEGEEPIEWRLLTTLMVATAEDASNCVRWYTKRWTIERYHYTLKSGCRIEELQLETADRLHRAIAVYSIVAWRLLYFTYIARMQPASSCAKMLSGPEWKALYCHTHRTKKLPERQPTLKQPFCGSRAWADSWVENEMASRACRFFGRAIAGYRT